MDTESNKRHWQSWVNEHGTSVRATTPGETAKMLEIEALYRQLKDMPAGTTVLEAGCGNGHNLVELAKRLPSFEFTGFDYSVEMIIAAQKNSVLAEADIGLMTGDVLSMDDMLFLCDEYDVVITDRCLINLDTFEKQKQALVNLTSKLRPGGTLLMIENIVEGRERQNRLREMLGLEARQLMPPFNRFFAFHEIDQAIFDAGFPDYNIENISSLHDLMLYVMVPALTGNSGWDWEYGHPLVKIATELCVKSPSSNFGTYGQNVLFVCRKP